MNKKQSIAKLNYLKIAPRKVRLIANLLKKRSVIEAESELLYRPQRAAKPLLKLLRSAVSNAVNKDFKKENLFIADIRVDQGPMLKRWMPRAQGRATPIHKKMSHIILVLEEKEEQKARYKAPTMKSIKSDKHVGHEKEEEVKSKENKKEAKETKSKKTSGTAMKPKLFQRKAMG
jgi:large subunit ribosomal protein L22